MSTTLPKPVVTYTQAGAEVIAGTNTSKHILVWNPRTREVHRDGETRVMARLTTERAFRVHAADHFGADRTVDLAPADLPHAPRGIREVRIYNGAIWNQIPCSCGHFCTPPCPTEVEARALMGAHLIATGVVPQQRSNS